MMVAALKIPLERRNRRTGRTEKARLWEITDRTVRTWIGEAVEAAAADGVTFSVPVTPHTFRHSYAMHPAEGAAGDDGAQVDQLDRGLYEGACARCRCTAPGAVSDAGC
ncbi:Resolvase [Salmonella enterica subsp. enterica serovar Braenderup]|nr:Resolvase [Salmonella enterica subsp. enterica serovar Braenderup]